MGLQGFQSVKFFLFAVIDGVRTEVVEFRMTHELNNIPRCTIMVPVGREIRTLLSSNIHYTAGRLTQTKPLELWMQVVPIAFQHGGDRFPQEIFRIFRGTVVGTGYRRTRTGAHFVIHAKHWLLDLDYSSSLSATSHPSNPHQFNYRASCFAHGAGADVDGEVSCWTPFGKTSVLNGEALSDFWEGGIKKVLLDLAKTDTVNTDALPPTVGLSGNDTAVRALKDIKNGVELSLRLEEADSDAVGDAITKCVLRQTYESFSNHTLWNKLVTELGPLFMFSIVPRVEDALVVPYVPGLRTPYHTIYASDYDEVDLGSELYRTLQAVGIFAGIRSDAGYSLHVDSQNMGIGGWYQPKNVKEGMVLLKNGPPWLSDPIVADRYVDKSTGGGILPIGTAFSPGEGPSPDKKRPGEVIKQQKQLIDAYARQLYCYEALKGRQGSLSGKFRLDIAPGSTVLVEGPSERFIAGDSAGQPRFAEVVRVTSMLNAEAQRGGTAMQLAHIRNLQENEEDGTSVTRPPIWETPWKGAPLLDIFENQSGKPVGV